MTPDSEGLHEIANAANADRVADIVFVHGLRGSSHSTWRSGKTGEPGHFFWPEELAKSAPHCGIWSVGYAAGITELGNPGMIIEKRAGNLASQLTMRQMGDRPIIFITHSMGGLVVKSLIVNSELHADAARQRLVKSIRGLIFCGTPHRGSAFASAAGMLGASQKHVREMEANAEPLDLLHDHFLAWHRRDPIPVESYAESIGLTRKNWWGRALPLVQVVLRDSANPNIGTIHDVDADHLALVKPSPNFLPVYDIVYRGVLRFIETALQNAIPTAPIPSTSSPIAQPPAVIGTPIARKVPVITDISRIIKYAPETLIGRDAESRLISDAWAKAQNNAANRPHVLTFVALGGEGKTSLVARWAVDLQLRGWPGCDAVFAWSFYSQGTREQAAASSDLFLVEALKFFGDTETAASNLGAYEKARRLARLVGRQRALLILDGVEPLQYSPTSPTPGELKDQGLSALLKGLAGNSRGLCVVTTRYSIADLKAYRQTTAPEETLMRLSRKPVWHCSNRSACKVTKRIAGSW